MGEGYSVAWRTFDAQYWGVPQRRRRIYLVADFAGERAGEVLFKQDGLRGNPQESGETREDPAADAEGSIEGSGGEWSLNFINSVCYPNVARALCARYDSSPCVDRGQETVVIDRASAFCPEQSAKTRGIGYQEEVAPTLRADVTPACVFSMENHPADSRNYAVCYRQGGFGEYLEGAAGTLRASGGDLGGGSENIAVYPKITGQLMANTHPGGITGQDAFSDMLPVIHLDKLPRKYIVRRLTPTECARLQGFPDWWCRGLETPEPTEDDIAWAAEVWDRWRSITSPNTKPKSRNQLIKWLRDPYSDAAEYKLWGNGIALPCAVRVMEGIVGLIGKEDQDG